MSHLGVLPFGLFDPAAERPIGAIFESLGSLPATGQKYPGTTKSGASDDLLRSWIDDPGCHLLVLSGGYGSGKSHLLNKVVSESASRKIFDYSIEDIPPAHTEGKTTSIYIDHFDEISGYSDVQKKAPDLRLVQRHLRQMKVCLVTNRPLTDKSHELVRQLRYRSRLDALGVRSLDLITLHTWSVSAVQAAVDEHLPSASRHFANIASTLGAEAMSDLLRPMVLRMLLTVISRQPDDWIPEYGEIYEQYLEHALSWDYDQGRSRINSLERRTILTELAYSVFSGKDILVKNSRRSNVISVNTIDAKLKATLGVRRDPNMTEQSCVNDFILSNRCLAPVASTAEVGVAEYKFSSSTIFEYFLARAIVDRFADASGIGIAGDGFNAAILDTRMLYFARRLLHILSPDLISDLLRDETLGNIDRLILLYLVEDSPGFIKWLKLAPESYFNYLTEVGQKNDWHFMAKIARFQLVSAARMSASEYIDFVQLSEEPAHLEVELQICRSPTGNVAYLEDRFRNEDLRDSAAISIYRIAQIEAARAKILLEEQNFLSDVQLRECLNAHARALESNARRLKPSV